MKNDRSLPLLFMHREVYLIAKNITNTIYSMLFIYLLLFKKIYRKLLPGPQVFGQTITLLPHEFFREAIGLVKGYKWFHVISIFFQVSTFFHNLTLPPWLIELQFILKKERGRLPPRKKLQICGSKFVVFFFFRFFFGVLLRWR